MIEDEKPLLWWRQSLKPFSKGLAPLGRALQTLKFIAFWVSVLLGVHQNCWYLCGKLKIRRNDRYLKLFLIFSLYFNQAFYPSSSPQHSTLNNRTPLSLKTSPTSYFLASSPFFYPPALGALLSTIAPLCVNSDFTPTNCAKLFSFSPKQSKSFWSTSKLEPEICDKSYKFKLFRRILLNWFGAKISFSLPLFAWKPPLITYQLVFYTVRTRCIPLNLKPFAQIPCIKI